MEVKYIEKETDIFKDAKDAIEVRNDLNKINAAYTSLDIEYKKKIIKDMYDSYYWLNGAIALLPSTVSKNDENMCEIDYQYILKMQFDFLDVYCRGSIIKFVVKETKNN